MVSILNIVRKLIIGIVVLAIIVFVSLLIAIGILNIYATNNVNSVYSCDLYLSVSEPIYNATLLIPLPSAPDSNSDNYKTFLNISEVTFTNFDKDNISARIDFQNSYPVLNISAEKITPIYKSRIEPVAILPGQDESELPGIPAIIYSESYSAKTPELVQREIHRYYIKNDDLKINTKQPYDKEPMFRPYSFLNMTENEKFNIKESNDYAKSQIEVPIYLSYEAESDNTLTISCELRGSNEWHVLGWQWNLYEERIENEFKGSKNGVYLLEGVLTAGDGVY
ncbi:MAG: hypothetical protein PHV39_09805 [Methanomicrobium sp.]|nr:hypothetical protein [Methanomicrobium sp.]